MRSPRVTGPTEQHTARYTVLKSRHNLYKEESQRLLIPHMDLSLPGPTCSSCYFPEIWDFPSKVILLTVLVSKELSYVDCMVALWLVAGNFLF